MNWSDDHFDWYPRSVKTRLVPATEFKAKCLALLDEIDRNGSVITITKRGQPVARVTPFRTANHEKYYGCLKGKIKIKGNIFSTGLKRNAQSRLLTRDRRILKSRIVPFA